MRNSNPTRGSRRETRGSHNNSYEQRESNSNDDNNNDDLSNSGFRPRKQHNQFYPQQEEDIRFNPYRPYPNPSQQHHSQDRRDRSGQRDQNSGYRERSGQRGGQYPDSSMGREGMGTQGNLGAVKFTPGLPTRELPPIETKPDSSKKFTGRCRLFVGNLAHNTTEEKVRNLFEPFGEIGELFLGPKSSFAFVKMDTKQNAEAARDALDCKLFEGRPLRVRLAAHAAAIKVKNLSHVVTNELLAYSFRYFGEIERAVVIVDDKGKSTGEGIVEYVRKQSAMFAIKRCQQECFMLTASPIPVIVEALDQHDEEEGLPEKSVNKNSLEFKEQRDVGPRFAEQGTFEHSFALKWKDLFSVEKQKRERLEQEIEEGRKQLQDQIEYSKLEHDTIQLRSKLQQLEDNRLKLQQMKDQSSNVVQQREEQRRQQDLLIRQQEEEILRRQQMSDQTFFSQQESAIGTQAQVMQDMMGGNESSEQIDLNSQNLQQSGMTQDTDAGLGGASQMMSQGPRTFADVAMMGMNQQFMQAQAIPTQMGMQANQAQQAMFASYIPPPVIQGTMGANYSTYQPAYIAPPAVQQSVAGGRQQKMTKSFVNQANNINVVGRQRKRGRFG